MGGFICSFNLKFVECTGNKIGHISLFQKSETKQNKNHKEKTSNPISNREKSYEKKSTCTEYTYNIYPTQKKNIIE